MALWALRLVQKLPLMSVLCMLLPYRGLELVPLRTSLAGAHHVSHYIRREITIVQIPRISASTIQTGGVRLHRRVIVAYVWRLIVSHCVAHDRS